MTRKILIAANWKMNGNIDLTKSMQAKLREINSINNINADVLICPPATLLSHFASDTCSIGAQNVSEYEQGAYTGELSTDMLLASGCDYVIIGHSERREIFGESSDLVAKKFVKVAQANLRPMLCIGEKLTERESGATEQVLTEQLDAVMKVSTTKDWQNAVIAYEPVWAIGTGKTATPEMAQETHEFLRSYLASQAQTSTIAPSIQILYGGSMKPSNAAELLNQKDIDGGLIGGASLDPESFAEIILAAFQVENQN